MLKDFSQDRFDVVVLAGQSNAKGHGLGPVDDPYLPGDRVWFLNNEYNSGQFVIEAASECVTGNEVQSNLGLSFARDYIRNGNLAEDRKLLIVRAAVGGTGFLQGRWNMSGDLYRFMMDMIRTALALNPENTLAALLWHQGETDAIDRTSYEVHYENLKSLLLSVRKEFMAPNLPFVAGDFVPQWKEANREICAPVIRAMRDLCRNCRSARFVESEGLLSNSQVMKDWPGDSIGKDDTIHFSRQSVYELGRRYYRAFCEIAKEI